MKKTYFSPESEEMEIMLNSAILVGSGDPGDGDPLNMGGGEGNDEEGDGF